MVKNFKANIFLLSMVIVLISSGRNVFALNGDPTLPDYMSSGRSDNYSKKPVLRRSDFKLSMIVIENNKRMAIINNKLKTEKSIISGAKILKINANSVTLLVGSERLVLNLIKGIGIK